MTEERATRVLGLAMARGWVGLDDLRAVDVERLPGSLVEAGLITAAQLAALEWDTEAEEADGAASSAGVTLPHDVTLAVGPAFTPAGEADRSEVGGERPLGRGARVGRYEVEALLGQGGMGRVYRAHDPMLDRRVALKVLRSPNRTALDRFIQEARAQARVGHAGICRVYEAGQSRGMAYIAMQLVNGGTLEDAAPKLSLLEKLRLVAEVAEAVHEAHRLGLIHRDVKPSNILVERAEEGGWRPFVTDFGLVREVAAPGLTVTGMVVGTPHFMAPEQARGESHRVDRRTDVYGLGATLYHALTGENPFDGHTALDVMHNVLYDDLTPPSRRVSRLPPDVETIVMKCLEKEQDRRYDSAKALAEDLRRYLGGEPILARRLPLRESLARSLRKHRLLVAVATAALLLVAGTGLAELRMRSLERTRAETLRRLEQDVLEIESVLRVAALLPLHDTVREKERAREKLRQIEEATRGTGRWERGARAYALGRAHLALREWDAARSELVAAGAAGWKTPELSYALGRAYGELYKKALHDLQNVPSKALREAQRRDVESALRAPALRALQQARGATGEPPAYVEGLLAFYEKRYDAAIAKQREAIHEAPWLFEARRAVGDVLAARALEERERGDDAAGLEDLSRARAAYHDAANVARSDPVTYEGLCRLETQTMLFRIRKGQAPEEAFQRALQACDVALAADGQSSTGAEAEAVLWARWAGYQVSRGEDPSATVSKALELSAKAARLSPSGLSPHVSVGFALQARAEYENRRGADPRASLEQAAAAWQVVTQLDPGNASAHNNLGIQWEIRGEWEAKKGLDARASLEKAAQSFEDAIRARPDFANPLVNLANTLRTRADLQASEGRDPLPLLDRAIESAQKAVALNPKFDIAYNNLGTAFQAKDSWALAHGRDPRPDVEKATLAYEKTLELNPKYAFAYSNMGDAWADVAEWTLATGGDPAPSLGRARAGAEKRLELDPGATSGFNLLARVHLLEAQARSRAGKDPEPALREALEVLEKATSVNAEDAYTQVLRGRADLVEAAWLISRRRPARAPLEAAVEVFARAVQLNPRDADPLAFLAEAHLRAAESAAGAPAREAQIAEGLGACDRALAINPSMPRALAARGALLSRRAASGTSSAADADEGRKALAKAFSLDPLLKVEYALRR